MSELDTKTTKPTKPNKRIKFGPYPKTACSIAHKHGLVACSLLYGSQEKMALLDLSEYSVFTMPAGASCMVFHNRKGHTKCELRIDQESSTYDAAAPAEETQAAPSEPDPDPDPLEPELPEDPEQICLCPEGEFTCQPHDIPDCGGPAGVCVPVNSVQPEQQP